MTDIGVPDEEDLATMDKSRLVDRTRDELAAAGKDINTMSDEELVKEVRGVAKRTGVKISAKDFGPRFSIQRDPEQGITFQRERDFTLGEQVRGRPAPPDTFFQNVPEAMAEAIGKLNQQNIDRDIDRSIEVEKLPGSVDIIGDSPMEQVRDKAENIGLQRIGEGLQREATQGPPVDVMEGQREFNSQMQRLRKKEDRVDPLMEQFDPSDEEFVNEVWSGYTGVLTPEKRQRALEDLKVYDELSDKEKFPKSLVKVSDAVNATKNLFQEGGNLSSREVKQGLSKISYIEAKFENVDQKGGGPARSMFQVEPATAVSLINLEKNSKEYLQGSRYQRRMAKEFERLSKINETIKEKYTPNKDDKNGVYKTLASMSEEDIENLLSISPIFAGTIAYAKILTKMTEDNQKKKIKFPSLISKAQASTVQNNIPLPKEKPEIIDVKESDEVPQVIKNFEEGNDEDKTTGLQFSAPYKLLTQSFLTKWFGGDKKTFTNKDYDDKTLEVLRTAAKNAIADGRTFVHYSDYPLNNRGVSPVALVGEYKDKDGNRFTTENKKELEEEVNAAYGTDFIGYKSKFALDLAKDPVMKAVFSIGGFSIQKDDKGYFIQENFNFNTANKTEGTVIKKVRKLITGAGAPLKDNEGPQVTLRLGNLT